MAQLKQSHTRRGQSAKLNSEQMALVALLVEEDNDATLVELCDRLQQKAGVKISRATMGRITQKRRRRNIVVIGTQDGGY